MDQDLDGMVAEATVDAYGDEEQITGLFTMIEQHLAVPFETVVLGVAVSVVAVDLDTDGRTVARCVRDGARQDMSLLDLPLPTPPPAGTEWIAAFRHWWKGTGG